jgi:hypothetical protein
MRGLEDGAILTGRADRATRDMGLFSFMARVLETGCFCDSIRLPDRFELPACGR